jgi:hypothetical protein
MIQRLASRLALLVLFGVWLSATIVAAANREWTNAVDGDFGDPANWTGGVPGAGDSATFDVPGTYTVTFDNDPNPLTNPVENQDLLVSDGTVTFESGLDGVYTYHLTGAGGDVVVGSGATLNLGDADHALNLIADDDLQVNQGGLHVLFGSQVTAGDLLIATLAGGGTTIVRVEGSSVASRLDVTGDTTIGQNNSDGTLLYRSGAQGSLSPLGTVRIGVAASPSNNTTGMLTVENDADIIVGNMLLGTGTSQSNGIVTLNGTGSTVQHSGSSVLTIGGTPSNTIENQSRLQISFGTAYTVATGTTTISGEGLLQIDGGVFTTSGDVHVNSAGDIGTGARINMQGGTLAQVGATNITVGAASGGTSTISLNSSPSVFSTGTGLLTINRSGVVDINSGTFNANGNVLINGGLLDRSSGGGSGFVLAAGGQMTIQNGGRAVFGGTYNVASSTASNPNIHVTGSGSRLEAQSTMSIDFGAEVEVESGGALTASTLNIGTNGLGTLRVSGVGSSVTTNIFGFHQWGMSMGITGSTPGVANVTFSNNALGTINGPLHLAESSISGTTAIVTVESGADMSVEDLRLASQGGATTSATLNVRDPGSSVTLEMSRNLTVGNSNDGSAVINVTSGGSLTVTSGSTMLNRTGRINIDGGIVNLGNLSAVGSGGKISFISGSLAFSGNWTLGTTGVNAVLGSNLTLNATKSLSLGGTMTVNAGSQVFVDEGGLLTNTSLINNAGELLLDGVTANITASLVSNAGMIRGNGRISGAVSNLTSGDVRVGVGQRLQLLGGTFSNAGDVVAIGTAGGPAELTITGSTSNLAGTGLIVGRDAILQFDGGLNNLGSLALNLGTNDVFGDIINTGNIVVTGGSFATFYDDLAQNGSLTVSKVGSTTSVAVFLGDFSGAGASGGGDIFFEGDLRPGASPAEVTYENNVYLGGGALLQMEIGGTAAGTEHDKLNVDGALQLDGVLAVSLIDDFDPAAGDTFDILDWTSLGGTFDTVLFPALEGGMTWDASQLYVTGELSVSAAALPGDFNFDGKVDGADYVVWRKNEWSQGQFDVWRANFGAMAGGGSGSAGGSPTQSSVPEPGPDILLLVIAGFAGYWPRHLALSALGRPQRPLVYGVDGLPRQAPSDGLNRASRF